MKKTWHEPWWSKEDDTSVFSDNLCCKSSQKKLKKLSLSLSSVYFGCWFKTFFGACMQVILLNCFCRWSLPRSELFCSVNSKLFLPGFLSLTASLRATEVVLSLYQYFQLVLLLHSQDRDASSCLVAVPALKSISLAKRYSPTYLLLYSKLFLSLVVPLRAVLLLDSKLFLSQVASPGVILTLYRYSTFFLSLITSLREPLFCWVIF